VPKMRRKHFIYIFIIIFSILFTGCRKSSRDRSKSRETRSGQTVRPQNTSRNTSRTQRKTTRKIPEKQTTQPKRTDTVVIVVPGDRGGGRFEIDYIIDNSHLPKPPPIKFHITRPSNQTQEAFFRDYSINKEMQDLIVSCDYTDRTVRNTAVKLAGHSPGAFNIGQVCDIFDFCYNKWKYVNDPLGIEYFADASETLLNGLNGDCDDFAILICSLILAIGGEATISFAYGEEGGHAFAEVNIGYSDINKIAEYLRIRYNTKSEIWYRTDKQGNKWLNLDWWAKHPGGKYFNYKNGTRFYIIQNYCEHF